MISIEALYDIYRSNPVISTDTRRIVPGSLFFALKGDKFNANTFAAKALEAGAAYAVIDDPAYANGEQYIVVDDALVTLQQLATYHRLQMDIPVIGLTGTNGKTTTKELINAVLSQRYNTLATQGNLNNHIGVPLTLLTITEEHEMAVIEMGANHQREIALLCDIARPTHGLITNVGKAHLEGFGGVEGVKIGKGEMYDYLLTATHADGKPAVAFVNSDDDTLLQMHLNRGLTNVIYYGKNNDARNLISGRLLESSPLLMLEWNDNLGGEHMKVPTHLTGAYNLDNILVAICISAAFGVSPEEISNGIAAYRPKNNRSQIMNTTTNTLICDFYNANPSSMMVAIDNMDKMDARKKVLVLGDMFEMGDDSAAEHAEVIQKALQAKADHCIFIGKDFYDAGTSHTGNIPGREGVDFANITFYMTAEDAIAGIKEHPIENATILIKGSRGMALERLVELF